MSNTVPQDKPFDLEPGLFEFYSSQAEIMLSQFENINRLLGPTSHHTHPGDFCEILLREFLRRFLPPQLSADKGFFYGRTTIDNKDTHCPEIDILIHDTSQFKPLFRMGDFVIVQPQSVRGIVQVKQRLDSKSAREGIENVVMAKQHLLRVLWTPDASGYISPRNYSVPPQVFSAVVGFETDLKHDTTVYQSALLEWQRDCRSYNVMGRQPSNMWVLPSFVGSLASHFLFLIGACNYLNAEYCVYDSREDRVNVAAQLLLYKFYEVMMTDPDSRPPFAFPNAMTARRRFQVIEFTERAVEQDGTVTLRRNDGEVVRLRWAKAAGPGDIILMKSDGSKKLIPTESQGMTVEPKLVGIEVNGVSGMYERFTPP